MLFVKIAPTIYKYSIILCTAYYTASLKEELYITIIAYKPTKDQITALSAASEHDSRDWPAFPTHDFFIYNTDYTGDWLTNPVLQSV